MNIIHFFVEKYDILILYWLLWLIFPLITCSLNCRYNLYITDVGYHPHHARLKSWFWSLFSDIPRSRSGHWLRWVCTSNYPMGLMCPMVSLGWGKPLIQPHKRWPLTPPHISRCPHPLGVGDSQSYYNSPYGVCDYDHGFALSVQIQTSPDWHGG